MPENSSSFRIIIKRVERPFSSSIDNDIEWICSCLGFFEEIDREKTASSVFKELVAATEKKKRLSSTELAKRVEMSRGSVINHLNRLQRAGLVVKQGRFYFSRSRSLFRTIREIEEDIDRIFSHMEETAKKIDKKFGIEIKE